jgi:hypothetical protein
MEELDEMANLSNITTPNPSSNYPNTLGKREEESERTNVIESEPNCVAANSHLYDPDNKAHRTASNPKSVQQTDKLDNGNVRSLGCQYI